METKLEGREMKFVLSLVRERGFCWEGAEFLLGCSKAAEGVPHPTTTGSVLGSAVGKDNF